MCQKHNTVVFHGDIDFRIDPCMENTVRKLREAGVKTLACCCGHGKYPETIIIKTPGGVSEYHSGIVIPRKKRFYVKDSEGIYYLPEYSEIRQDKLKEDLENQFMDFLGEWESENHVIVTYKFDILGFELITSDLKSYGVKEAYEEDGCEDHEEE